MTQLHDLLDTASRAGSPADAQPAHDIATDIRLGRRALLRRRLAAAGGGVAAATLAAGAIVGGSALFNGPAEKAAPAGAGVSVSSVDSATTAVLVDADVAAGPFHFAKVPQGWVSGASSEFAGNLVPAAGGVSQSAQDFAGKITALPSTQDMPEGINTKGGAGVVSVTRSVDGPGDVVSLTVQVPKSVGLTNAQLTELAQSVTLTSAVSAAAG
ncbi:hypothetical protein [Knoellia subterranea]|uniref:Uncharacterized protein n=1 Tax=Knoellia subterranea KCTC 19937 TaxID=1385521 RepID=A0A0A0JKQ1_9MICO|nr:hypothetical protein [Knoellia subterranea]KGN37678.1 hypothetical protein N803_11515 [Knoellia subterranea KCTC 19937]